MTICWKRFWLESGPRGLGGGFLSCCVFFELFIFTEVFILYRFIKPYMFYVLHMCFIIFWQFYDLLTQIQCAHKLSLHVLCRIAWRWDWWWWPLGCPFPALQSWRGCERSQHWKICSTSAALQVPWHRGPGTSGSHWAACAPCSWCPHDQCWASGSGLKSSAHPMVLPLGFCQLCVILTYWSDWCRMNFVALFLTIRLHEGAAR